MANVVFENYSAKIKEKLTKSVVAALDEIGGTVQAAAARNSRVDTGQLKNSWDYKVNEGEQEVTIGSPLENAIWEEFGTGIHADNGNGRKTPWIYTNSKGETYRTVGKRPNHTLQKAIDAKRGKVEKIIGDKLKGGMD